MWVTRRCDKEIRNLLWFQGDRELECDYGKSEMLCWCRTPREIAQTWSDFGHRCQKAVRRELS